MALLKENKHTDRRQMLVLLAGVFLVSFSLLTLEISFTRVLSVMLAYHYVFIVISLALLGLGAGGIFVHIFRRQVPEHGRFSSLARFAALFSLSIPLSLLAMARLVPTNILLYCLFLFFPFFFAGVFLTEVFRINPAFSSRIYGVDLLGAAAGSFGAILSLNVFGAANTLLVLGVITAIAALLYATITATINLKAITLPAVSLLMAFILLGTNMAGLGIAEVPIGKDPDKEILKVLNKPDAPGEIVETRWSAFGRTDLVAFGDTDEAMGIYLDGTAGSPMFQFSGDFDNPGFKVDRLTGFPGYLPIHSLDEGEKDSALIIGPGGGRDVLLALMEGVGEITAVEVNKELVDIVREYAWYNGGIYTDLENISVYVDEGRNFLKRQPQKYDIIMLSIPITKTSRSPEGFALTENFLFTTDSIKDYLQHLTDEGRLIVVAHDPTEILRLLSISLTALNESGVSNEAAMEQIYFVGSHHYPVFVLKKTPFELGEMVSLHQSIHELGYDPTMSYVPVVKPGSCTPHMEETRYDECGMLFPPTMALSQGLISFRELEGVFQIQGLDVSPVTDNSPFFYKSMMGVPQAVSLVFWASIIALLLVILVPFMYLKNRPPRQCIKPGESPNKKLLRAIVLFSMLGAGFMLVEISAIQRFILFLGQPVLSIAVLLFSLLVGAGLGSLYSGRVAPEKISRVIAIIAVSIVAVLLVYAFSLSFVLEQLLGLALAFRLLATFAMLAPLGFLMGFPFPLGLRLLKETGVADYIPWMWGINGVGSVSGSALTVVVALSFGFTEALILGAGCYFTVFLVFRGRRRGEISTSKLKRGDALTANPRV